MENRLPWTPEHVPVNKSVPVKLSLSNSQSLAMLHERIFLSLREGQPLSLAIVMPSKTPAHRKLPGQLALNGSLRFKLAEGRQRYLLISCTK